MDDKPMYAMPDLAGPSGNAWVLLGIAQQVLKLKGMGQLDRYQSLTHIGICDTLMLHLERMEHDDSR